MDKKELQAWKEETSDINRRRLVSSRPIDIIR
jgi:hypothetical protein